MAKLGVLIVAASVCGAYISPTTASPQNREQPKQATAAPPRVQKNVQEPPLTECDTLTAHELDPRRKADGVPFEKINPALAIPVCKNALKQFPNSPRLAFQLGRAYDKTGDFNSAITQYRTAADRGYAPAQYNFGIKYYRGEGIAKDEAAAVGWYRRAAGQGYAPGQTDLGFMYEKGQGVAKNERTAVDWYRKAAEQGYAPAQTNLGIMYEYGQGVVKDYGYAITWYRKAAEQGYALAQSNLGTMYLYGQGVAKDDGQAVIWYQKAADQGNGHSQDVLGSMYYFGQGVPENYVIAHKWFNLAAARGAKNAADLRDSVATKMTSEQIAEAQRLAREWKPKPRRQQEASAR